MVGATLVLCPNVALDDQRALQLTFSADNVAMNYTSPPGVDVTNRIYYIYIGGLNSSSSLSVRFPFTLLIFILVLVHAFAQQQCACNIPETICTHALAEYVQCLCHFYCYTSTISYIVSVSRIFLFLLRR